MNPTTWITIGLAVLSLAGQVATLILTLRIRVSQLESEKRVLDEVAEKYVTRELYEATRKLEERRA